MVAPVLVGMTLNPVPATPITTGSRVATTVGAAHCGAPAAL